MKGGTPGNKGQGLFRQGKTLLSGIDPAGRAERAAAAVPVMDRTLYLCPSPLYAYGLEHLLARLDGFSHSAVLCVEADPELFALAQEHFPLTLKNSQKLRLTNYTDAETLCALLRQEWGPRFFRRVEVVRLNGGWQLHHSLYDMLADSLRREIALDWGNAITLTRLGRRYIRNALRNLSLIPRCYSLSQLSFADAPVLVLGAGPSLDTTLDGLCSHFDRALLVPEKRPFRIICVDTCLPVLKERGIRPDLAVILESQHWNLDDFIGLSGWNVPAALDFSALPSSSAVLSGGLFLFFTPWTQLNIFERLAAAGLLPASLPPLGSVGLSAAFIARRLTRGTIIIAGLDFSFTLDSYHARSTPGHKGKLRRHNRFTGLLNADAAFGGAVSTAVSKTGAPVFSNPSLRNYRDLFEREFAIVNAAAGDATVNDTIPRFFDLTGSGLPLGLETISPEAAFTILSAGNPLANGSSVSPCADNPAPAELPAFIRGEQNRLTLLRNMLTGESAMNYDTLAALVNECDYLWAHFPDYAAADRRPGKAELESGNAISFLKRLRVEIDPFLKLWELALR
ncbi:MAG: DUF115 domain-containing protein [Treponema sp.]|jgi:hypothetical protein|nr:DUF115 domain-containing protein [Treponema sp.]